MSVTGGLAGGAGSACPVGPAWKPRAAAGGVVAQSVYGGSHDRRTHRGPPRVHYAVCM